MVHTVGIAGVNGNMGVPTAKALIEAVNQGKIKLVIFHRDGSKPEFVQSSENIELRVLDFKDPVDKIEAAVKGVNVFISMIAVPALPSEPNLVKALANSPDLITFFPSVYSTTWEPKDYKDPHLSDILIEVHGGWDLAKEKKLGVTVIYSGVFDYAHLQNGFLGSSVKDNVVQANEKQLQNPLPITTMDHLAHLITRLVTADPETIKNREYSAVTYWATGQEIADLFTKINGKPVQIKAWTDADRDAHNASRETYGPLTVGYMDRWENASFKYDAAGRIVDDQYQGPSLEEVARSFL